MYVEVGMASLAWHLHMYTVDTQTQLQHYHCQPLYILSDEDKDRRLVQYQVAANCHKSQRTIACRSELGRIDVRRLIFMI